MFIYALRYFEKKPLEKRGGDTASSLVEALHNQKKNHSLPFGHMLHHSSLWQMRVLCLTMLPEGGAMKAALKQLGYKPYTLRSSFQQGHASTHPIEWSKMLDGAKPYNPTFFGDYDSFVGPPASIMYNGILQRCPEFTKVILVEEPDKATWAANYDAYMARLSKSLQRTSKNRISKAFNNMLEKMVVRGGSGGGVNAEISTGSPTRGMNRNVAAASARNASTAAAAAATRKVHASSAKDLEKALAAEAARQKKSGAAAPRLSCSVDNNESDAKPQSPPSPPKEEKEEEEEREAVPLSPRAQALEQFEESVKMSVPSYRLLVYRYGDGWEPLCQFLEKAVPTEPFPPYDDGLLVIGALQNGIERARVTLYILITVCVVVACVVFFPQLDRLWRYVKEAYADYQIAFGSADEDLSRGKKTAEGRGGRGTASSGGESVGSQSPSSSSSSSDAFEEEWRRRGGQVTRTSKTSSKAS